MKFLAGILLGVSMLFGAIDINHADKKELSTLKGVGDLKAVKIIEYRKAHGCFKDVTGLTQVKGIGEGILVKNQANMKALPCK